MEQESICSCPSVYTVIIGEQLQYHDEIAELIADVEGLRAYVRNHINQLYIAAEQL